MAPDIIETADSAFELKRRYEDEKILFYKPCCRPHKNACPVMPCPESKHTKFHLSTKRIRVIFGANRSSKSYSGLSELLFQACFRKHPMTGATNRASGRYRVYCSDFGVIEKFVIPLIKEWIPRSTLKEDGENKEKAWENSYDPKYHILYLKGNVTIDFMSYDQDASKSESVELDGVWADEEMPEMIYAATIARLISRGGRIWLTVTPLYGLSWAMKFLDSTDPQVEVFHFEIYDNPYISDQAIKEFEDAIPEHEKEARLYGRFIELQGLVYKELRNDIHLIGSEKPKSENPIIFCIDPHPRKASVMTWAFVTGKDDIIFFDELEMKGVARDMASAIRRKEAMFPGPVMLRIIDPAAKAQGSNIAFQTDTLQEFEREGMSFTLADNSDAGYNIVHEYLTFDPSKPVSAFNRPKCFFTKDVPKTWFGMTHLMWDEWTFKKQLRDDKERIKDYKKDFPDTVRYTLAARPSIRRLMHPRPLPIGNYANAQNFQRTREVRNMMIGGNRA